MELHDTKCYYNQSITKLSISEKRRRAKLSKEERFCIKRSLFAFGIITCVFILKQLFASGSVIIGEYSPWLRLGEYSPIITSHSGTMQSSELSACRTVYNRISFNKQPLKSSGGTVPGAQHATSHYARANDFHSWVITKYRKTNESVYQWRFNEWINIVQSTFNVDVCFTHYNIRSKQKQFCTHSSPFFQLFTQYFSEKSSTNKRNSYSIPCAVCRAMSSNCRTSNLLSMTWRCRYKLDPSHHWVTIASWGLAIQPINSRMLTCRVFLQYKKKPRFYPGSESQIAIEALKRMRQAPHLPPPLH